MPSSSIREETGIEVDLSAIPLSDPEVYALFSEGKTNGIFQFESGGMKAELRRLKPERFEDLIALNALYRPGPMDMIPDFIRGNTAWSMSNTCTRSSRRSSRKPTASLSTRNR